MKLQLTFIFLLFSTVTTLAQVMVMLDRRELKLSPRKEKYKTPLTLSFSENDFKNKVVSFYADAEARELIVSAKFGDDISRAANSQNYEIVVNNESVIQVKDNKAKLPTNKFFVKIGASKLLEVEMEIQDTSTRIDKENTEYQKGSIIKDALAITSKSDLLAAREVLRSYGITNVSTLHENKFLSAIPDLDRVFSLESTSVNPEGGIQSGNDGPAKSLISSLSSIGGLDVTTIADGFAKFIVKRTKQELSITFFQKFKDHLIQYPDLKTLFPHTYKLLLVIDEQVYNYSAYLGNLREAFRTDLKNIDKNLPTLVDNHRDDIFKDRKNFELGVAIKTACYVSSSARHNMHAGDILDSYPTNFLTDNAPTSDAAKLLQTKGAIQSLQLFSESLRENKSGAENSYWVRIDVIRQLVNDKQALKIYIGLCLQVAKSKYAEVKFAENKTLYAILNTDSAVKTFDENYQPLKTYLLTLASKANELNTLVTKFDKEAKDSVKVELFAQYFKATSQLLEYSLEIVEIPWINKNVSETEKWKMEAEKYFEVAEEVSDLAISINRKNYADAINHALVIYDILINKPVLENTTITSTNFSIKEKNKLVDKLLTSNDATTVQQIKTELKQEIKIADQPLYSKETLALLAKYGAFMASIVNAKTSDQVAEAIEAAAMPVGSASVKRNTTFNVALNAYCGFFSGNEVIKGLDKDVFLGDFKSFGITAPIGISISHGNRILPWPVSLVFNNWQPKGWSSTYFISVVDIGAIAAYRFTNDQAATIPNIELKNIISPGIFWSLGIPKTPLSFAVGAQIGPNLRKVNDTTTDYASASYVRYSLSLSVDIPLLNLYNK